MTVPTQPAAAAERRSRARRELLWELISGVSGLALALFMWGHLFLVGSILLGARGFDALAGWLEDTYIAQPTVVIISLIFVVHAIYAGRKIPARIAERKRMTRLAADLDRSGRSLPDDAGKTAFVPHLDSKLWIWQVRTGIVILVLGSFHIGLLTVDVLTPLWGERAGIEAATTLARVGGGLWLMYGVLLLAVEFHASVGLYRLAVKWGVGSRLKRSTLKTAEHVLLWVVLGLGGLTLFVLAGWLPPPLAFLMG